MSRSLEAFRDNLVDELEKRNLSIAQVAFDLGMSRPSLSRVIHGHDGITIERAERIANYLEVPLVRLLRIREKVC